MFRNYTTRNIAIFDVLVRFDFFVLLQFGIRFFVSEIRVGARVRAPIQKSVPMTVLHEGQIQMKFFRKGQIASA